MNKGDGDIDRVVDFELSFSCKAHKLRERRKPEALSNFRRGRRTFMVIRIIVILKTVFQAKQSDA